MGPGHYAMILFPYCNRQRFRDNVIMLFFDLYLLLNNIVIPVTFNNN